MQCHRNSVKRTQCYIIYIYINLLDQCLPRRLCLLSPHTTYSTRHPLLHSFLTPGATKGYQGSCFVNKSPEAPWARCYNNIAFRICLEFCPFCRRFPHFKWSYIAGGMNIRPHRMAKQVPFTLRGSTIGRCRRPPRTGIARWSPEKQKPLLLWEASEQGQTMQVSSPKGPRPKDLESGAED